MTVGDTSPIGLIKCVLLALSLFVGFKVFKNDWFDLPEIFRTLSRKWHWKWNFHEIIRILSVTVFANYCVGITITTGNTLNRSQRGLNVDAFWMPKISLAGNWCYIKDSNRTAICSYKRRAFIIINANQSRLLFAVWILVADGARLEYVYIMHFVTGCLLWFPLSIWLAPVAIRLGISSYL